MSIFDIGPGYIGPYGCRTDVAIAAGVFWYMVFSMLLGETRLAMFLWMCAWVSTIWLVGTFGLEVLLAPLVGLFLYAVWRR